MVYKNSITGLQGWAKSFDFENHLILKISDFKIVIFSFQTILILWFLILGDQVILMILIFKNFEWKSFNLVVSIIYNKNHPHFLPHKNIINIFYSSFIFLSCCRWNCRFFDVIIRLEFQFLIFKINWFWRKIKWF